MKEAIRKRPNHGMEEWLILHIFYNVVNLMSEAMLDTTSGAIIMGKPIARRYTDCKYIMLDTTEGGIIIDGESTRGDGLGHNVKKKVSRPFFFHFFF